MKILITGRKGLAMALANAYSLHDTVNVSRSTGHNINNIDHWGSSFLDFDMVFNCAYDGRGQESVLEYFFNHWKDCTDKTIVTIGSKIINQPRLELDIDHRYWPYRQHKQSLQKMHDNMLASARCNMKIINPGPIDTNMILHLSVPKMSPEHLANKIYNFVDNPDLKRVDLWL